MHIADLSALDSWTVAIGWLEPGIPYTHGAVPREFLAKIGELARLWAKSSETLGMAVSPGHHSCGFCGKATGVGTFGVPEGERLFYCPKMIAHYVEQHEYSPPAEFVASVLACPLPGTPEYFTATRQYAERLAAGYA